MELRANSYQPDSILVLVFGLIITVVSFSLIIFQQGLWYFPAVFGVWLVFDYFASKVTSLTAWQFLLHNKKEFVKLYFLMLMLGCTTEFVGRFLFKFWDYPFQTTLSSNVFEFLHYPFFLMPCRDIYVSLSLILRNKILRFVITSMLGVLIWEVPNLAIYSWVYQIPLVHLEIAKINIMVLVFWMILVGFTLFCYKEFVEKNIAD